VSRRAKKRPVKEFHFVCRDRQGVRFQELNRFESEGWVVSVVHAEDAKKTGALFALHQTKTSPSYLQGRIVDWNFFSERKDGKQRIGFIVERTTKPLQWRGTGSGEKGYLWS
jgi:hypothetical protein